jgi:SAM-dependent methyltransferase
MEGEPDQWITNARRWALVGPPMKPSSWDVGVVERAVEQSVPRDPAGLRAVILGVTPELATLRWPAGTSIVGVDQSAPMIRAVWPRTGLPARASVVRGDWRAMPLGTRACDVAVGDGSFNCLAFPADYRRVSAELRRVLSGGGLLILRTFIRAEAREPLDAIVSDLWSGATRSIHAFKLRLHMHLQPSTERGIRFGETWELWRSLGIDAKILADRTGHAIEEIDTIETYRGSATSFSFPSLAEVRDVWANDFDELACSIPAYELGDRCPTLVLRARSGAA